MSTPLISCVLLTRNRSAFACQAIWYFLRQAYPEKELIVVDDGEDQAGHLLPVDDRIRYLHLPERTVWGRKRNIASEISRGDLIALWSETDWIGPDRLTLQAERLQAFDADVCGFITGLHYCLQEGQAWRYTPPPTGPPWLATDTLLYRRSAWSAHRFAESDRPDDASFLSRFSPHRVRAMDADGAYISIILPGDRGLIDPRDSSWQRMVLPEVTSRMGWDQAFYAEQRHGPGRRDTHPPTSSLTLAAPFFVYDGIGSMAEYLALGLSRAGVQLNLAPFRCDRTGTTAELQQLLDRSRPDPADPALCFGWLGEDLQPFQQSSHLFINTMWETSRLPARYLDTLNAARAVIVPSKAIARVFRDSGVVVPIDVVPQGVDPAVYHYEERPEREEFVTLLVGSFTARKNFEQGIAAWKDAFAHDSHARLIIKSRFRYRHYVPDDPRVTFVDAEETTRGISHWYRQADVLMALGNEGFGLPLVEGMATGLPVIALYADGQSDVCEEAPAGVYPVYPDRYEPYDDAYFGSCGVRGIPAVGEIAARLRWLARHRAEAREAGKAASAWVLQHRNVWDMGPNMLLAMEAHLGSSRPLRRCLTLWRAPGEGDRLADLLAGSIPWLQVTAKPPDLRSVRVLHIQFQEGVFNDLELTSYVRQATYAGIPVVVAAQQVTPFVRAWEGEAAVLAASSPDGAQQLQARWPNKQVELLELGNPHDTAQRHLSLWTALAPS
jgi:hypothetical protein